MRPINQMPLYPDRTSTIDLIDKINEIIDRVNYMALRNTPLFEGEPMEDWRKIQEAGGKYIDPAELKGVLEKLETGADQALKEEGIEPYSSFIKRMEE